jgi:integrase/recombinase XerD
MKHLPLQSRYFRELLTGYARHLERVGYNPFTIKMLPSFVREFFHRLEQIGIKSLEEVTPQIINNHYRYLKERPCKGRAGTLSESMLHGHLWAIRIMFSFLQAEGRIDADPFSLLSFPAPKKQQREILTREEIEKLYQACETSLDRAILGLFYGCGLRKSEAQALNIKDISFRSRLLYVRSGKGKRRRVVPVTGTVTGDLKKYYHVERVRMLRKSSDPDREKAFILNSHGERMLGQSFWRKLRYLVLKAGIENPGRITLHSLRHSIATHLLGSGLSVEQVRDFLGHTNIESTQVYTRINNEELKNEELNSEK